MNTAVLALVGLGAVGLAVAASGKSGGTDSPLVSDAKTMVRIFELYSKKRTELTQAELDELGSLNAAAKGLTYMNIVEYAKQQTDLEGIHPRWRKAFFLPPGVNEETGPDAFSIWGDDTELVCTQYMLGGACHYGYYTDWFFRNVGAHFQDNVVRGESDLEAIGAGFYADLADAWQAAGPEVLKAIAAAASNYPGIGTAIASAVTFLEQVGSGASIEDATLAAGRAAIPSTLRSAYDVGVGLATQGELDVTAALEVAMAAAISQGVITGDVLDRYNTIKAAYEDAKEVQSGLGGLATSVEVAI